MFRYLLIMLAMGCCLPIVFSNEDGLLTAYWRIRVRAIFANATLRRLIFAAGALLIASLVWQLAGFDFAFVFGGEVMAYLEIAAAIFIAAARARMKVR